MTPETIKLLGSAEKDVDKDNNGEDVPKLESVEIVLVNCNIVNSNYPKVSKVLLNFLSISPVNYYFVTFINNAKNY